MSVVTNDNSGSVNQFITEIVQKIRSKAVITRIVCGNMSS